jgi:HK97 gp10 family phage protein
MARVAVRLAVQGDKALIRKLEQVASEKGLRKEARGALLDYGEELVVKELRPNTPRKTGALQDSEVAKAMVSAKKEDLRVTLKAGGPTAPYAPRVHETHKTKGKFLEKTIRAAQPKAAQEIAVRIDLRKAAS